MKLTKKQIRDIIMEELKNLENENDALEENKFKKALAGLGLAAATAFGAPSSAQAAQPSAGSQINLTRSSRSPSMLANRYDDNYGGVLKDKSTGEQFVFKKDKDSITVYKLYGGDKVDLSSERTMSIEQAEQEFDLKPGWIQKTSKSQITPDKAFSIKENNMKITKGYLKQVIMEELERTNNEMEEGFLGNLFGKKENPDAKVKDAVKNLPNVLKYIQKDASIDRVDASYVKTLTDIYRTIENTSKHIKNSPKATTISHLLSAINSLSGIVNILSGASKASWDTKRSAQQRLPETIKNIETYLSQI